MSRPWAFLAGLTVVVIAATGWPPEVRAWDDSEVGYVHTEAASPGYENPPNADKNAAGYTNPCLGREGFEAHVSRPTTLVKSDTESFGFEVGGDVFRLGSAGTPGGSIGYSMVGADSFVVEFVEWVTACAPEENSYFSEFAPGTTRRYWIRRPTQTAVVADLLAEVVAALPAPELSWPSADPEFDWIYVNTSSDVRVEPVNVVRRSRSRSNLVGSVTAWVAATPSLVEFDPGEPGKGPIECTYESAIAPYFQERATGCFYKYTNSSAISTEADSAFVARTSVSWEIASSGPLTYSNPLSWREELVQVAEVQALVISGP